MRRQLSIASISFLLLLGLTTISNIHFGSGQGSEVTGILYGNIEWTKANSPYNLTGPVSVYNEATLTVEAGTVVNLKGFYLQVNGTLRAVGSSADKIVFTSGRVELMETSIAWNPQTGLGCSVENAVFNEASIIVYNASPKINNTNFNGGVNIFGGSPQILNVNATQISGNLKLGQSYSPVISYCTLTSIYLPEFSCTISNCLINGGIETGNSSVVSNNVCGFGITVGNSSTVSNNRINLSGKISAGKACTISSNTVNGLAQNGFFGAGGSQTYSRIAIDAGADSTVSNNNVTGNIQGSPTVITNNIIRGGGQTAGDYFGREKVTLYAVDIYGNTTLISGNNITADITGTELDYPYRPSFPLLALNIRSGSPVFTNNRIIGEIDGQSTSFSGNAINGTVNVNGVGNSPLMQNNTIFGFMQGSSWVISNNSINGGIYAPAPEISSNVIKGEVVLPTSTYVHDNTISMGQGGIDFPGIAANPIGGIKVDAGDSTIERNLIVNGTGGVGISISNIARATIRNNTIANCTQGIAGLNPSSVFVYNNILNCQHGIYLFGAGNCNATYNWWGATDAQAINQTIHDFKNDFNLGNVTFIPFLSNPNPNASPVATSAPIVTPTPTPTATSPSPTTSPSATPQVPEFSSWVIVPIMLVAAIVLFAAKARVQGKTTQK